MPSGEEEREEPPTESGDEEAREASSNESRGAARLPFLDSWENGILDIRAIEVEIGVGGKVEVRSRGIQSWVEL